MNPRTPSQTSYQPRTWRTQTPAYQGYGAPYPPHWTVLSNQHDGRLIMTARPLYSPTNITDTESRRRFHTEAMASQQNVLDPRLGAPTSNNSILTPSQYSDGSGTRPTPPGFGGATRAESLKAEQGIYGGPQQSPQPQPYYHYPSPQTTQTPQQSNGHSAQQSNQTSPEGNYGAPVEAAGSPDGDAGGEDTKRPRACEACRGLKVRYLPYIVVIGAAICTATANPCNFISMRHC